ncbi:hypothetical protein [Falsiroseomonas sp. E2-1-a20]|uniref:hypothetical protein n=1 Tax=Falsiroseomonas sp. E2-1-a20 TaxID=3239300 RepID=UPI003F3BA466
MTEAEDALALLADLERGWTAARRATAGHRRRSRTPAAVDLMAALPLLSATSLAGALGISIKSALAILDRLVQDGVAVQVTGRAARRLFGLRGLAPLAAAVAPPRRPEPGRGRGRPRRIPLKVEPAPPTGPIAPLEPVARVVFDYSDLDAALRDAEAAMRRTRRSPRPAGRRRVDAAARGRGHAGGGAVRQGCRRHGRVTGLRRRSALLCGPERQTARDPRVGRICQPHRAK